MMVLARGLVWGAAFVGLVLVYLPGRILAWSDVHPTRAPGLLGWAGAALAALGVVPMAWSFLTFVFRGKGTAAPFDPPRHLVAVGPYRHVRNPMYLGAALWLLGVALHHASPWLGGYLILFLAWAHLFVRYFEEPRLARRFGDEYQAYAARVRRWIPGPGQD